MDVVYQLDIQEKDKNDNYDLDAVLKSYPIKELAPTMIAVKLKNSLEKAISSK